MIERLYQELMIIGLVSLLLYLVETSGQLSLQLKHALEMVHFSLLVVFVGYMLLTFFLVLMSVKLTKYWDELEKKNIAEYERIKARIKVLNQERSEKPMLLKFFDLRWRYEYRSLVAQSVFQDLRLHFIHSNRLPASFSFASYLRSCKRYVFVQLANVHATSWVAVACVLMSDLVIRGLILDLFKVEVGYRVSIFIFALVLIIVPTAVWFKLESVLSDVLRSEIIDFDPIAAKYYIKRVRDDEEGHEKAMVIARTNSSEGAQIFSVLKNGSERRKSSLTLKVLSKLGNAYKLEEWGNATMRCSQSESKSTPRSRQHSHLEDAVVSAVDPIEEEEPQVNIPEFKQEELFWFGSHAFMLHCIQITLVTLLFYLSIIASAPVNFFLFESAVDVLVSITLVLPLPTILVVVPLIIPIYTIIINVGQLVDVDIVEKAKNQVQRSAEKKIIESERLIERLVVVDRKNYKEKLIVAIFKPKTNSIVNKLCLIAVTLLALNYCLNPTQAQRDLIDVSLIAITSTFVIEILLKGWLLGSSFFFIEPWIAADCMSVMLAFIGATLPRQFSAQFLILSLLVRLVESRRPLRTSIMLETLHNKFPDVCQTIVESKDKQTIPRQEAGTKVSLQISETRNMRCDTNNGELKVVVSEYEDEPPQSSGCKDEISLQSNVPIQADKKQVSIGADRIVSKMKHDFEASETDRNNAQTSLEIKACLV